MKRRFGVWLAASAVALTAWGPAASAAVHNYVMTLNGLSENPRVALADSIGHGSATIAYDDVAHTLALHIDFADLTGNTTATHFHAVTSTSGLPSIAFPDPNDAASAVTNVGVATTTPSLAGFPLGVKFGSYTNTLDLTLASSWNPAFVTAQGGIANAEAAFAGALAAGKTYWNVHTSFRGGGEIRGFPVLVPEPAAAAFAAIGFAALLRRRR